MNVVITGASSGIGRGLVRQYLTQGHDVMAISRHEDRLLALEHENKNLDGALSVYSVDVRAHEKLRRVVEEIIDSSGHADLVIASTGIAMQRNQVNLDVGILNETLATNLSGVANTFECFIDRMVESRSGQLVVISSLAALYPLPRTNEYCAAKVALNLMMESLHWRLKPHGIRVTTICPGFVDTPMTRAQNIPDFWLMSLENALEQIALAITSKRLITYFPRSLALLLKLLGIAPAFIKEYASNTLVDRLFPPLEDIG